MTGVDGQMTALTEAKGLIAGTAERVGASVVGLGRGWGVGSGVVIAPNQVLTNAHNVRRGEVTISFSDDRQEAGRVAGADPDLDLAVVSVDTGSAPAVDWDPEALEAPLGTPVVALANPGGRGLRATLGFVSSEGRSFRGPRGRRIAGVIEHTAPLPRGSSGGPLVDTAGRLLGLNSVRLDGGLILAVPATAAARERARLLARGEVPSPRRLGVAVAPPRVARRMRRAVGLPERSGVLVRAVEEGSPAERSGIERGDLIVAAGDRQIDGIDPLYASLDAVPPGGGTLELTVVRGTEERQLEVALGVEEDAA